MRRRTDLPPEVDAADVAATDAAATDVDPPEVAAAEAAVRERLPPGATLRAPTDADAPRLQTLIGGVFAEYPGCVLDPDGIDADLAAWATALAAGDGRGWVVEGRDGALLASVGCKPTDAPGTWELTRLYVAAGARRAGLGGALVGLVEAAARARGARAVQLWSDTRFADAHRLYERLGYVRGAATRDLHDPSETTESFFLRAL